MAHTLIHGEVEKVMAALKPGINSQSYPCTLRMYVRLHLKQTHHTKAQYD
jgi:hypothetical protein